MSPMFAREMAEKRSDSAYPKSPQVTGIIIEGLPFVQKAWTPHSAA